ncbi:MAG: methylmalonyl-CoA mutase, partial [Gemmatimonadetes bacterium]|nr:methylmalonyl-CoA mutase [Gemmatimonadota bacterium]
SALEAAQRARVREVRQRRDQVRWRRALDRLGEAARAEAAPMMPAILEAVRARATVGEISDCLRAAWGTYRPPV